MKICSYLMVILISLCLVSVAFAQSTGSIRYVNVRNAEIKENTFFFSRTLAQLSLGDEVSLLRDTGRWSQIRAGNITGWVSSSILSTRRIVPANTGASVSEVALAGKGLSPDMELEFQREGLDYSLVDYMESIIISQEELLEFINEGRLRQGE